MFVFIYLSVCQSNLLWLRWFLHSFRRFAEFCFVFVYSTCVLFADISGFTALCEAMEAKGPGGDEYLAKHLNSYFELLLRSLSSLSLPHTYTHAHTHTHTYTHTFSVSVALFVCFVICVIPVHNNILFFFGVHCIPACSLADQCPAKVATCLNSQAMHS